MCVYSWVFLLISAHVGHGKTKRGASWSARDEHAERGNRKAILDNSIAACCKRAWPFTAHWIDLSGTCLYLWTIPPGHWENTYSHCRPRPIDCCVWGQLTSHWTGKDVFTDCCRLTGQATFWLMVYSLLIKYADNSKHNWMKQKDGLLLLKGRRWEKRSKQCSIQSNTSLRVLWLIPIATAPVSCQPMSFFFLSRRSLKCASSLRCYLRRNQSLLSWHQPHRSSPPRLKGFSGLV